MPIEDLLGGNLWVAQEAVRALRVPPVTTHRLRDRGLGILAKAAEQVLRSLVQTRVAELD